MFSEGNEGEARRGVPQLDLGGQGQREGNTTLSLVCVSHRRCDVYEIDFSMEFSILVLAKLILGTLN